MSEQANPYQQAINSFRASNEGNYIFACQAAVPLVLTPDLLYQLWNNFKQYQYTFDPATTYKISHIAVSDLILSGLCREVGYEIYEIEKNIRDLLLADLGLTLGIKRRNTIAAFLKDYAMLEYRFGHRKDLKDIHLLTAASILDPGQMEKQIIDRINQTEKDADKINYLLLHQNLLPLGFKSELGDISKSVASKSLSPILISVNDPNAPGVLKVKLPASLRKKVIDLPRPSTYIEETQPVFDAMVLANECLLQQNTELDLGNCGLTDDDFKAGSKLDEVLIRCTHLLVLRLNNYEAGKAGQSDDTRRGKGLKNRITTPPPAIFSMEMLERLYCFGEAGNRWGIRDMSFVSRLPNLKVIDLSYNKIYRIAGLQSLFSLQKLELGNNRIREIEGLQKTAFLRLLNLEKNQVTEISGLDNLINLQSLNLSGNKIDEVKGLQHLQELEELHLAGNKIDEIKNLAGLNSVRKLFLEDNNIKTLHGIEQLAALEYLDVSRNSIMLITARTPFPALRHVRLEYNEISTVSGIQHFPVLETLDLSHNQLSDLELLRPLLQRAENPGRIVQEFSQPNATYPEIIVHDNPLENPPMEIVLQGNDAILDYFGVYNKVEAPQQTGLPVIDPAPSWITIDVTETSEGEGDSRLVFTAVDPAQNKKFRAISIINKSIVDPLLANEAWTPEWSMALFQLLLPDPIDKLLIQNNAIIWGVDKTTKAYPWEMLQENERSPMAATKIMVRNWRSDQYLSQIPGLVKAKDICIIGDPDVEGFAAQIPAAREEAEFINNLCKQHGFKTWLSLGARSTEIIQTLFNGAHQVVHIAAHNVFNETNVRISGILIGKNVYLTTAEFMQMRNVPKLVFINCCHSGKTDMAQKLLENGTQAVIVVEGMVTDQEAVDFSKAFYERMFAGDNFGNAVLQGRRLLYSKYPQRNAWGIYQCYGDPLYRFADIAPAEANVQLVIKDDQWHANKLLRNLPVARLTVDKEDQIYTGFLIEGATLHPGLQGELVLLTSFQTNASTLGARNIIITFEELDKNATPFNADRVSWAYPENDIVLLRFDPSTLSKLRALTRDINFYTPAENISALNFGDEISLIGHFGDGKLQASTENNYVLEAGEDYFQYEGPAGEGDSGSPVFNQTWQLLGIFHSEKYSRKKAGSGEDRKQQNKVIRIDAIRASLSQTLDNKIGKKIVKIFLSCPQDLNNERGIITRQVRLKNEELRDKNIWFILFTREDDLFDTDAGQQVQNNILQADIFIMLTGQNLGHYSQREFDIAIDQFKSTGKPLMYTYLKNPASQSLAPEVEQIRRNMKIFYQFFTEYKNGGDLEYKVLMQLEKLIAEINPVDEIPLPDEELQALVKEYNELRRLMPTGNERTRLLEGIKSKMEMIGQTIIPLLPELITSGSGGRRLAAVTALYEFPDMRHLSWLCERIGGEEQAFIGYHATLTLSRYVNRLALRHKKEIEQAINISIERAELAKQKDPNQIAVLRNTKERFAQTIAFLQNILNGLSAHASKRDLN